MKKVLKKRTGFTLVELLIVIIIIGILAGAMLLVAGSGTDKAEATKIVSNLRSLKAATLMFYADNPNATVASASLGNLTDYMDRQIQAPKGTYVFTATSNDWFVGLTNATDYITTGVANKLADVAKDVGLYKNTATASSDVYDSGVNVYMKAR